MRHSTPLLALLLMPPVLVGAESPGGHRVSVGDGAGAPLAVPRLIAASETRPPQAEPLPPPGIDEPGPATAPLGTAGAGERVTLEEAESGAAEKVLPREGGTRTEPDLPQVIASQQPLPEKVQPPDDGLPDVTIRTEGETRVEEYRRNGQIYMVRFVPRVGVPYTYLDTDGDGRLEGEPGEGIKPVYYTLYEWE